MFFNRVNATAYQYNKALTGDTTGIELKDKLTLLDQQLPTDLSTATIMAKINTEKASDSRGQWQRLMLMLQDEERALFLLDEKQHRRWTQLTFIGRRRFSNSTSPTLPLLAERKLSLRQIMQVQS